MFDLGAVDRKELIALKFADADEFRRASRLAVRANIPVEVPGDNTLIVRELHRRVFEGLKFELSSIASTEKVSDAERATLRRRVS
jgi:hypothetical protein